jgi:hypothetical protein
MFDNIRSRSPGPRLGVRRRDDMDPLLKSILFDLLITTCGFASIVVAVVLTVQGLSLN